MAAAVQPLGDRQGDGPQARIELADGRETLHGSEAYQRPRATPSRRSTWVNGATLFAVAALLVLVSLPRLQAFARGENEDDAAGLMRRLGRGLAALTAGETVTDIEGLVQGAGIERGLDDFEWLEDGAVLRRHGYLFDVASDGGKVVLRAWPWSHGRTGRAAFVATGDELLRHENRDARWSGRERPPRQDTGGWAAVR